MPLNEEIVIDWFSVLTWMAMYVVDQITHTPISRGVARTQPDRRKYPEVER